MPSQIFNTRGSLRPFIDVGVGGADGTFHNVNMMVDTGNDVTLIKRSEAARLGLKGGTPFQVSGISGKAQTFHMVRAPIRIGSLPAKTVRIGIGDVPDNLLGREDISKDYTISFRGNDSIEFQTNVAMASDSCGFDNDSCADRFRVPNPYLSHDEPGWMAWDTVPIPTAARISYSTVTRKLIRDNYYGGILDENLI